MLEGKKTLSAAFALIVAGLLEQVDPGTIANMVPTEFNGIALASVGLLFAILRFITKTPVKKV